MAICQQCWQRFCNFDEFLINLTHNQCNIKEQHHNRQDQQVKWLLTEYDTEDSQADMASLTLNIKEEISTEDYMITANSSHIVTAATSNNRKLAEADHKKPHPVKRSKRYLNEIISKWKSSLDCGVCQKSYADFSVVEQHFSLEHPKVKPYIVCCKKKQISRYDIADHATFHMDSKAFQCPTCKKCFTNGRRKHQHNRRRHCKELKCYVCNKLFSSAHLLKDHMWLSHKRFYKCPFCPLTSIYVHCLKKHLQRKHPELWSDEMKERSFYESNLVDTNNTNQSKKQRTSRDCDEVIAQWKSQLECGICQTSQTNYLALRQHFSRDHGNEKAHILCCQRKLQTRNDMAHHARFHMNPESFKCHKCGITFTGPVPLRRHMEFHIHGDRTYKCLNCPRTYNVRKTLNLHLMAAHPQLWSERDNITNFYESMQISKELFKRENYRTTQNTENIISQWKASLECGICQKPHNNFSALTKHFRLDHPKEKAHILCCDRKLLARSKIAEHASWHLDPEAFKCPNCGKCYKNRDLLRAHICCNRANKHICSICDKACRSPLDLREHMAVHTKTNLYDCPACPYTCRYRSNMHQHLKSKHLQIFMERNDKKGKHLTDGSANE